jgi:hypothetical protein
MVSIYTLLTYQIFVPMYVLTVVSVFTIKWKVEGGAAFT